MANNVLTREEYLQKADFKNFVPERGENTGYECFRGTFENKRIIYSKFESPEQLMSVYNDNYNPKSKNKWAKVPNCAMTSIHSNKFDQKLSDGWTYGELDNFYNLMQHINKGEATKSLISSYEKYRIDLLNKYPALNELDKMSLSLKKRKVFKDSGDELDIDRYLNHQPEMWQTKSIGARLKRTAKIGISMPTSAVNSSANFSKCIAFLVAISDIIESAGISTELSISYDLKAVSTQEDYASVSIVMKRIEDMLDIQKLLISGTSGIFRTFVFGCFQNITKSKSHEISSGLGSAMNKDYIDRYFTPLRDLDVSIIGGDVIEESRSSIDLIIKNTCEHFGIEMEMAESID